MRADIRFLTESFSRFNELCFGGLLPQVNLRMSSSLRMMGSLRHPRVVTGSTRPSDFTLSVSDRLDHPREVVEDTIIHEMIHLYIIWMRIPDTSSHGPAFRNMMETINRRHGRHITVSHRSSADERASDRIVKPRIVLVCRFADGTRTVTVCSPRYLTVILEGLKRIPAVREWRLIATGSPQFARYPTSRTLKFYRMPDAEIDAELARANPIEIHDGKLRILPRKENI